MQRLKTRNADSAGSSTISDTFLDTKNWLSALETLFIVRPKPVISNSQEEHPCRSHMGVKRKEIVALSFPW